MLAAVAGEVEPHDAAIKAPLNAVAQAACSRITDQASLAEVAIHASWRQVATQAAAGTNYRILCVGAPTVPDAESELCVVDVYEDLNGKAEFSDIRTFDLLAYV